MERRREKVSLSASLQILGLALGRMDDPDDEESIRVQDVDMKE